jgi:hypothetical protein
MQIDLMTTGESGGVPEAGYRMQDAGCEEQETEDGRQQTGCKMQDT